MHRRAVSGVTRRSAGRAGRLPPVKRLHRVLAATAVGASTVALSACSFFSPLQTAKPYAPGDGVSATSGAVRGVNLVVVSEAAGKPGAINGAIVNAGDQPVSVTFQSAEGATTAPISVPAKGSTKITGATLDKVAKAPGYLTDIYLVTPQGKTAVSVPVLKPEGPYEGLGPKA